MPKYEILAPDGTLINTIICAEAHVQGFTPEGGTARLVSVLDRPLGVVQQALKSALHSAIGAARGVDITDVPHQDWVYQRKEAEARRYLADRTPLAKTYPLLSAEAQRTGQSLLAAAEAIAAKASEADARLAALETYRFEQAALIDAATEAEISTLTAKDHRADIADAAARATAAAPETTAVDLGDAGTPSL